ncbi:CHAD domain-containing protein [Streptomyces hygroscopicus]|uniref:CHAD domain-containing protein n=1 Tax=Streptomyces hygroscopicus TaxID=1912 RepID=UPI0036B5B2FF
MVQRHDLPPAGMTDAADAADAPRSSGRDGSPGPGPDGPRRPGSDGSPSAGSDAPRRPGSDAPPSTGPDGAAERVTERTAGRAAERTAGAVGPSWGESATAGEVLSAYLHAQAGDFLRSLRLHRESGSDVAEAAEAARLLRRAARRISGALHVYRPITDPAWSDQLRTELAWLSGTLAREHAYAERLTRLRGALYRLSGAGGPSDRSAPGEGTAAERVNAEEPANADERVNADGRVDSDGRVNADGRFPEGAPAPQAPNSRGSAGASSATDATGAAGASSATGALGATGVTNATGATGATGGTNATGAVGARSATGVTSAARTERGGVTVAVDGTGGPPGSVPPRSTRAARRSVSLAAGAPGGGAGDPVGGQGPGPAGTGGGAEGAAGASRDEGRAAGRRRGERRERGERGDKGGRGTRGERGNRSGQGSAHQRAGAEEEARGGALTVGAARAGALLERQLTLARTRAHTAALEALGSSRFHAVADSVALLASEVPLDEANAARPARQVLPPLAELAGRRLAEAVEALPLGRAGHPYNADALVHGLAATPAADAPPASERQDAPWHQVRHLLRMRRYALEVLDQTWQRPDGRGGPDRPGGPGGPDGPGGLGGPGGPHGPGANGSGPGGSGPGGSGPGGSGPGGSGPGGSGPVDAEPPLSVRLLAAGQALERHRDAAEAAAAAAAAARTPRIAPATAYALGVLHADQRHEVEAARFAFGRIWRRVAARAS